MFNIVVTVAATLVSAIFGVSRPVFRKIVSETFRHPLAKTILTIRHDGKSTTVDAVDTSDDIQKVKLH